MAMGMCYPLVNIQKAIENGDFPIEHGDLMGLKIVIQWDINGIYPLVMSK